MTIGIVARSSGFLITIPITPRMNLLPILFAHQIMMNRYPPMVFPRVAVTPLAFSPIHSAFFPPLIEHILLQNTTFSPLYFSRPFAPVVRQHNRRYASWAERGQMLMPRVAVPYHRNDHLYPRVERPVYQEAARSESEVRADNGIREGEETYTGMVRLHNDAVHDRAERANVDGGEFLKGLIAKQSSDFRKQVAEADSDVYVPLAKLALEEVLSSKKPLPHFMSKYTSEVQNLRNLTGQERKNKFDSISTRLISDVDFIEAIKNSMN